MPADGAVIGEEREDNDYKSPFLEEWMQKKKMEVFCAQRLNCISHRAQNPVPCRSPIPLPTVLQ